MHATYKSLIIQNDLDSLAIRIEDLPAHPRYTTALELVRQATTEVELARIDLHRRDMENRFGMGGAGGETKADVTDNQNKG